MSGLENVRTRIGVKMKKEEIVALKGFVNWTLS